MARPFLPARDFPLSRAFYRALGFPLVPDGEVAIFGIGQGGFILQRYFVKEWAENCMMQLMVDDLDGWWAHIAALDLPARFGVAAPRPPAMQSWGYAWPMFLILPACSGMWRNGGRGGRRMRWTKLGEQCVPPQTPVYNGLCSSNDGGSGGDGSSPPAFLALTIGVALALNPPLNGKTSFPGSRLTRGLRRSAKARAAARSALE